MFGIFNRKPQMTDAEKIIDSAMRILIKERDHHLSEYERNRGIALAHGEMGKRHMATYTELNETLSRMVNPPVGPLIDNETDAATDMDFSNFDIGDLGATDDDTRRIEHAAADISHTEFAPVESADEITPAPPVEVATDPVPFPQLAGRARRKAL